MVGLKVIQNDLSCCFLKGKVLFRLQPPPGKKATCTVGGQQLFSLGYSCEFYSFAFLVDKCEFLLTSFEEFTFKKPSEKLFFENLPSDCLITEPLEKTRRIDMNKLRKCIAVLKTELL